MATESFSANPAFGAFNDVMNQSRAQAERSMRVLREEMIEFLNRRHDHNGETLADYQHAADFAGFMAAQEKWMSTLHRDYLEATSRMADVSRKMFAENFATAKKNTEAAADTMKAAAHDMEAKAEEAIDRFKPE